MSTSPANASASPPPAKPRRIHWKTGTGILLVGLTAQAAGWFWIAPDRTYQVMSVLYVMPATLFLLLLWWTFLSGFSWRTRLIGLGVVGMLAGAFFAAVRIEDFEGDMVPVLAWRWTPSREARAAAWRERAAIAGEHGNAADAAAPRADGHEPSLAAGADDWPRFRGPAGDSTLADVRLARDWERNPPLEVWRHPIGPGWSSFAVVGPYAFTQEQRGDREAVVCYEFDTGREVWSHTDKARFSSTLGGDGPRATPTFHDGRLYTLGATGILNCLDPLSGARHWATNILEDAGVGNISWGMAASPLVYDDFVVVNPGGNQSGGANGGVAAYDRLTGEKLWAQGNRPASYCAPQLVTLLGERQLLIFDGAGLAGHDPRDGRTLWFHEWANDPEVNAARPLVLDERTVFISSGYARGAALVEVTARGGEWSARLTGWGRSPRLKAKFNDFVHRDAVRQAFQPDPPGGDPMHADIRLESLTYGFVYGLDEGVLCCLDLATGERRWRRGRYGYGQLLLVDDLLLVLSESGEVVLVEATPESHREVASFRAISGKTWNHPVLVRGKLLVRNAEEAACYELPLVENVE